MAAATLTSALTRPPSSPQQPRDNRQTGWLPAPTRQALGRAPDVQSTPRRLSMRPCAAAAAADLATYEFQQRRGATTSEWFQQAIREVVKRVDEAPVLQTVVLGESGGAPHCSTYAVHDSVVAVPELWQGIAEHLSQQLPDVVLLVQRVSAQADADGSRRRSHDAPDGAAASPPDSPRMRSAGSAEMRAHAAEVTQRLVSSGVANAILLHGQVGDCCDGQHGEAAAPAGAAAGEAARQQPLARTQPSIVPFSPARRAATRAAALRPVGAAVVGASPGAALEHTTAFWGVVVQSRRHTGAEGCYLLNTVKSVTSATGCSCTHFSLTRITQGEHLEQQFVQSWLL